MPNFEPFRISELRLDERNYRTGPVDGQRAAILAVIDNQKQKLVNLAKDILVQGGISPGEPIWVARDPSKAAYVVIEGNRRVTALKILDNPALADGTVIEKPMRDLAAQFRANPIREVTACVFASFAEAEPWRRRRHLNAESGVGLQPWDPLAKNRANRDHGKSAGRVLAVYEYLQDESDDWQDISTALDSKWTTVERVLNAAPMKALLGVNIDPKTGNVLFENGDEAAGRKLLRQILSVLASPSFDFAQIEKKENREVFLSKFAGRSVKIQPGATSAGKTTATDGGTYIVAPSSGSSTGAKPIALSESAVTGASPLRAPAPPATRAKLDTTKRKTLAPKKGARTMTVNGVRLNGIYRECREIEVENNENAAALLLRVFIELSSEAYLTEKAVPIPSSFDKKGRTAWDDIGIPLAAKIRSVIDDLDPTRSGKRFQAIRVALDTQSHGIASINTLHGYFHNRQLRPDAADVMGAWDVWENYLWPLHAAR